MPPDTCAEHHDLMLKIDGKLDAIIERLGKGDVTFATVTLRVDHIERVVYGAMALALTAVSGAILALVVKH
jgi:hypothetical protein